MIIRRKSKSMRAILPHLARRLRGFSGEDRGNVAMMLALSIVPLMMGAMGALDLTRGLTAKVELQDALDAAALAAGRSSSTDASELQQIGQSILRQNLAGATDFQLVSSSFTLDDNGVVVAQAQASFSPTLAGLVGPMTIGASAEVKRANNILEIAMVLDNTGSMGDSLGWNQKSKLSYLKTAASDFVDVMAKAAGQSTVPNSIKISLVPFSNTVNVGADYRNESWLDQDGVSPINDEIFTTAQGATQKANRFTLFDKLNTDWGGCVEMRKAPYDIQDTAPSTATPATLFTPYFAPDENDDWDRANDYAPDPKGNNLSWWAKQGDIAKYASPKRTLTTSTGPNAGCSLQALQRLTTNFSGVKSAVDKMVASGDTDIPLGLMWGWHTLSPKTPFADGVPYLTPKHKKIVVLMTDGENTMSSNSNKNNSSYSSAGYVWQGRVLQADGTALKAIDSSSSQRTAALDSRLKKLCTNMKAADVGIEIYTVGVGVTSDSKTLLQGCATDSAHYFDVTTGTQLTTTFQAIANQIAQLHLSK